MKEIGFGIVGTGSIASRFARACAMVPGVCAAGISSRSAENGRKFAAENGVDRVYENPTQMALDPRIDIVYVATPHPFHYENCMAALRAGKPILSEKPMAMTAAQARDIFETAKKSGLFAMEGMWSRFLPNIRQAKAWIEGGRIGRVKLIDGIFSFAVDEKSPKPRLVEAGLGGGAMYDLGVYTIEMASYFAMAEPQEWAGFAAPYAPGVDAQSVLTLRYPNDVLATLRMGITCDAPCMMTIMGDKGRIELPRFYLGNDAILYENGVQTEHLHDSFELPKGFVWQIEAVRDALLAGQTTSNVVPPETTIACAAIMEDMMRRFFPEENV